MEKKMKTCPAPKNTHQAEALDGTDVHKTWHHFLGKAWPIVGFPVVVAALLLNQSHRSSKTPHPEEDHEGG